MLIQQTHTKTMKKSKTAQNIVIVNRRCRRRRIYSTGSDEARRGSHKIHWAFDCMRKAIV